MTLKCYSPGNKPLGFLHNVFDLKITKEIGGMEELTFFIPANSPEAKTIQLEGYIVPEGEQIFVIRELNTHGKDIEVYCMLAIETLYGYCWSEVAKQGVNLVEAFEYVLKYTGWKFVNKTSTPARTRDIYIQNQTVWEALKVICEVYFVEMTVDTHTHTITAYDSVGQDNGVFFISDMNLVNFRKDTNTHKLITRLIPIGKDGLNITSVNGGKDYIDNNTYSDKLLYGLWMQSAYTNPTQLKEDATKWLAEYAKPYITYNIDIIDLYRLNGNQLFKFNVGDGVTIFDKVTEEKVSQRVVKIEIYPQDPTRNTLELSNKGKTFSDYFQMIQLMQNMANHFIQTNGSATGTGGTNGSSNPNLKDDIINGDHIQSDSIGTDHLQSGSITTDKITSNSITTDKLVANSVTTDKLTANSITSDKIQANSIKTEHLQANIIDSNKIFAGAITTDKLQAGSVTANKIASNSITTDKLVANSITSNKIQANTITTSHLQANSITSDKIGANAIEAKHIRAGVIDSQHISSESIKTEHLQAGSITSDTLQTGIITSRHLQTGSITAEKIQTGAITAGSGIIANGAIGNAQISSINANKINAGEIDTSKVKVKGSNGYLFIEDNTLYVVDNNKQIRCELGVISNKTNYGFIVRGADGKTILIDHNGVHNAGITDGAIDNRKVSENANISGKKLDIDSVIRTINEDGSISIQGTKVQVGNTTLDVELSKQTNLINNHTTQLNNQQASINANTSAIKLKVDSQTYTADKNNMTTQMNKNTSAISVLEKEIELKVEQTDITTAINGVQVGGTNLLRNTYNPTDASHWSGVEVINVSNIVKPPFEATTVFARTNNNTIENYAQTRRYVLEPNTTYTISYYVYIDESIHSIETYLLCSNLNENNTKYTQALQPIKATSTKNKWIKVQGTVTTGSDIISGYVRIDNNGKVTKKANTILFTKVKLEKGNKATDWTPSPEDVVGQIDTKVSSAKAEIKATTDSITQSVSSLQTTTSKIQSNINNLQVGGRNLVAGTSATTEYTSVKGNNTYTDTWIGKTTTKMLGTEYVVSFDAKADSAIEVSCYLHAPNTVTKSVSSTGHTDTNGDGHCKVSLTTGWKRYWVKWTQTSTDSIKSVIVGRNFSDTKVYIRGIKLEDGHTPTAWSPAPEDVQSQLDANVKEISTTKSKIASVETNLSGITSRVSNVESKTTTLDSKVASQETRIKTAESKITDSAIINTVSSTIDNKVNVGLNSITIGGTNLVKQSKLFSDAQLGNWIVSSTGSEGFKKLEVESTSTGWLECYIPLYPTMHSIVKPITISFEYMETTSNLLAVNVGAFKGNARLKELTNVVVNKSYNVISTHDNWKYVSYTMDISSLNGLSDVNIYKIQFKKVSELTGKIYVRKLKVEYGNKPTSWTPAPEDIQGQLDTNANEISTTKSKVATVETNLSGITSRVSNVETKTSSIDGRVTSQEARIKTAESKITDSAIINTVSSTIDTKVNDGVNGIVLGGENLLRCADFIKNDSTLGWVSYSVSVGGQYNGVNYVRYNNSTNTSNYVDALQQQIHTPSTGAKLLEPSTWYTLSFYANGSGSVRTHVYPSIIDASVKGIVDGVSTNLAPDGDKTWALTSTWTRHTYTFKTKSSIGNTTQNILFRMLQSSDIRICMPKLEKGNKASDWSISTRDVQSNISKVEQTANSITSTVSDLNGKYTQIKQTVDKIDLTGKVSFSDLSTAGKTTINGANITTGTLSADRVLGGTLKGVSLQTYSGTNTTGVRIHPGGMQLNDTSFFYNNDGKFELQCKQGVAFSSQKDIHIMPGLLASGTPSGSGNVVIPSATLRTQKLYVVNNATFESGLSTTSISASSTIRGRNNVTLDRGSVYIPRLNSNITTDYLRLGGAYISGADSGAIHFNYSSSRSGALARGTVYLPSGGGNNTTDHLAFHSGIIACVDSGNFHFITAGGGNSTIYPRGVVATYSLDNVARTRTTSKALDIVSSVPVTQTVEGFMLDVPKARTIENEQLITASENEQTGELDISTNYNAMLGTMWKAIQELQQEVKELKDENEELRKLLNKGE